MVAVEAWQEVTRRIIEALRISDNGEMDNGQAGVMGKGVQILCSG